MCIYSLEESRDQPHGNITNYCMFNSFYVLFFSLSPRKMVVGGKGSLTGRSAGSLVIMWKRSEIKKEKEVKNCIKYTTYNIIIIMKRVT